MFYIISLLALFIVQCQKIITNPTPLQNLELIQDRILGLSTITSCIAKTSKIARIICHKRSTFVDSKIYTAVSTLLGGKPFYIITEIAISKLLMQGCFARERTDKPLNSSAGW